MSLRYFAFAERIDDTLYTICMHKNVWGNNYGDEFETTQSVLSIVLMQKRIDVFVQV